MQTLFRDPGVVDRNRADADPDLTFHFDAHPNTDPTPNFTHLRKSNLFWASNHSRASLHCLIFLISVIKCNIWAVYWNFLVKVLTINVPLFKKLRDIIFFCGTITFWAILRDILRGQDFFDPLNCPKRSEGQFRGKKSWGPLKMSREMAHKVIVPKKKIMSQSFLNSGTLVILCLFATMGPQLCPTVS